MKKARVAKRKKSGAHQLWGGRFKGGPHPALEAVNRSIDVDFRLWPHDIRLSKAWATALVGARVLTARDAARIRRGLDRVGHRIAKGVRLLRSDEDVHTLIIFLRSVLSAHYGKLVFPHEWQPGGIPAVDILAASDEFEAGASSAQKFVVEVKGLDQQLDQ